MYCPTTAAALKLFSPLMPDAADTRVSVPPLSWKATALPGVVAVPKTMYCPMTTAQTKSFSPLMPDAADTRVRVPPLSWKATALPGVV